MSKIAVTGAGGYIGSILTKQLLDAGHEVLAIDRFFFGEDVLNSVKNDNKFKLLKKDIRDLTPNDLKGLDAVCDLASLSNDPAGEMNPELTYDINRDGRIHVAKTTKAAGVARYILSSSCSVYGKGEDDQQLTENSKTGPISVYAKSTLDAEHEILPLGDGNFTSTALRNATVFGLSPRMRFDLVINLMTLTAFQKRRIIIMGGGDQWRPIVHASDVARAFINVAQADASKVQGEVFNIGLSSFQIKNLAYIVREVMPFEVEIEIAPDDPDKRDYNVNFDKAQAKLGFVAQTQVDQGAIEIYNALKTGAVEAGPKTITVQWYRQILEAKALLDSVTLDGRII
ncbi:MAG: SDR family oxidoreductase [Candidatus Nanopelagicales bacterium]